MSTPGYTRLRFLKGRSLDNGFALIERAEDENFRDTEWMDWFLIRLHQGTRSVIFSGRGEADDLWASPAGVLYLVASMREGYGLHVGRPTVTGYAWNRQATVVSATTYVRHVWGASEETVIAWGGGVLDPSPDPSLPPVNLDLPTCWMGSGDAWKTQPGPGWVYGMGGHSFDALLAVGNHGLVARWDGQAWKREAGPAVMDLSFVQVLPTGETYGASYYGRVFKRTEAGWKEVGEHLGSIYGLVRWQDMLLVATGHGIYRIEGETLVVDRPNIAAYQLEAGERLLWADESHLYDTDGISTNRIPLAELCALLPEESLNENF